MADNTRRYGFRWIRSIGGVPNPKPQRMRVASAYAPVVGATGVNINVGDPVLYTTTGTAIKAVGSEGTQTQTYGVCVGFGPRWDGSAMSPTNKYVSGTTYGTNLERQTFIYVVPVVGQLFEIDADATLTDQATAISHIGANADFSLTADTSDASNPKMTPQLAVSTINPATATLQLRIEDLSQTMDNVDWTGAYAKLLVTFNRVQQAPYQTTCI